MTEVRSEVRSAVVDGVAVLTLDAPDRRNAMTLPMCDEVAALCDALEADESVGALVVTGAGSAFCAGADLSHLGGGHGRSTEDGLMAIYEGFLRIARSPLPTIAAVNGPAVGAGMNLALACDLRLAARSARFDARFLNLGIHPGGGHTWMSQRIVGPQTTAATVLFGEIVDGAEAERVGLVWRCVDDDALIALLDELPKRPLLAGRHGLRLSLAGAQSKLPVVLVDGAIALPGPGQPTTHILKPPIERFSATTENEAFAMTLAAEVGLSVARVQPRVMAGRRFLLIERYDRAKNAACGIVRLHQEDFCQALGIPPERKYAAERGPTFKTGFELLRRIATRPAVEVLKLLDAAIFNLIVGNADAHGKNYSLLYGADGVTLAPLYDLLSTVAYPQLSPKLAMKIARCATLEEIDASTWSGFAADAGLAAPFVRKRVRELAAAVAESASNVAARVAMSGLSEADLVRFATLVAARAGRLR